MGDPARMRAIRLNRVFSGMRRFFRLEPRDRRLVIRSLLMLPLTALAVRVLGFRRCYGLLGRKPPIARSTSSVNSDVDRGQAVAKLVCAAAEHGPYRANCLQRSLALFWLLRREGIASEIRIGARKLDSRLEAHAWVEVNGQVLNDPAAAALEFVPFECLPSPGPGGWK